MEICDTGSMKKPIMVRPLSDEERATIEQGLHSSLAFTLRRSQILLASARGQTPPEISRQVGCSDQAVREAIQAFHQEGLTALAPKSKRPHTLSTKIISEQTHRIITLLHRRPREFGYATSLWTLDLIGQVSLREGIWISRSAEKPSGKRCYAWASRGNAPSAGSPVPILPMNEKRGTRSLAETRADAPDWVVGFADEVWWSRVALPARSAYPPADHPLHLVEQSVPANDSDPKALAC